MSGIFRERSRAPYIWAATYRRFPRPPSGETPPVHETFTTIAGAAGRTNLSFTAPPSLVDDNIIEIGIFKENTAAITPPTGFTLKDQAATDSPVQLSVFWGRAPVIGVGPYDFTWTGATFAGGSAHRVSGAITSGDPYDITRIVAETGAGDANTPDVAVTTGTANCLATWFGAGFSGGATWTPPTSFTEILQVANYSAAVRTLVSAGGTGTIVGIQSGTSPMVAWVGVLKPIPVGGGGQNILPSAIASGQAFGTPTVVAGAVTISPSSIASAEVFGTARIVRVIQPTGIASAEAFGTPNVIRVIKPTGIASAEAFGTAKTVRTITPSGIASAEAFGSTAITNARLILPSGIASAQAFGTPTVVPGVATILPSGIASAGAFGTAKIIRTVFPTGIISQEAFGTPKTSRTIQPTAIASGQAFGIPKIVRIVSPSSIASAQAFGTPTIVKGAATIIPSGIASGLVFGDAIVSGGTGIVPPGIASAQAFGTSRVTITKIYGIGIPSAEAFGTAVIGRYVLPISIASQQAFGTPTVQPGVRQVSPTGIASAQAFGTAKVSRIAYAIGIASSEVFGNARVGITRIYATGIPSAEELGIPGIGGEGAILPSGIASGLAFGVPKLSRLIFVSGIPPAEVFGTPQLRRQVLVLGIPSEQIFGLAALLPYGLGIDIDAVRLSAPGVKVSSKNVGIKTSVKPRGPTVTVR